MISSGLRGVNIATPRQYTAATTQKIVQLRGNHRLRRHQSVMSHTSTPSRPTLKSTPTGLIVAPSGSEPKKTGSRSRVGMNGGPHKTAPDKPPHKTVSGEMSTPLLQKINQPFMPGPHGVVMNVGGCPYPPT